MKKVLFTAIAMVAFSSVSMGNTIENEEVNSKKNKKTIKNKVLLRTRSEECGLKADAFLDRIDPEGNLSSTDAYWYFQGYYDACMR